MDKKKEPEKPEIRAEDELAHTITIWICRVWLWVSLIFFSVSFFRWYEAVNSEETNRVWGSFFFALFWFVLTLVVEGAFRNIGQEEDEPKADAVGFHAENDGDNSGSPV